MNPNDELIICEQSKYNLDDFKEWYLNWHDWLHYSNKNESKVVKLSNLRKLNN